MSVITEEFEDDFYEVVIFVRGTNENVDSYVTGLILSGELETDVEVCSVVNVTSLKKEIDNES